MLNNKYLKYKNKYLNLKKSIGGNPTSLKMSSLSEDIETLFGNIKEHFENESMKTLSSPLYKFDYFNKNIVIKLKSSINDAIKNGMEKNPSYILHESMAKQIIQDIYYILKKMKQINFFESDKLHTILNDRLNLKLSEDLIKKKFDDVFYDYDYDNDYSQLNEEKSDEPLKSKIINKCKKY
jgi:hypothetical protein